MYIEMNIKQKTIRHELTRTKKTLNTHKVVISVCLFLCPIITYKLID